MTKKLEEYSREELIEEIKALKRRKKFGLVWEDKKEDIVEKCKNEIPVLKEVPELAINEKPGEPTNLIIEGDNFASLQVLNYTHHGKIDVIYIDPPYNTGNKDFIYNDIYIDKDDSYCHSKWLSFMSRRLELAKNLLSDEGIIYISIDDNEQAALKMLCDSIFGREHFVNTIIWQRHSGGGLTKKIITGHDYVLCYRMNNSTMLYSKSSIDPSKIKMIGGEPFYFDANPLKKEFGNNRTPSGLERYLVYEELSEQEKIKYQSDMYVIKEYKDTGKHIIYPYRRADVKKMYSIVGCESGEGINDILKIGFKKDDFPFPKPVEMVKKLVFSNNKKDSVILDFFAGSGTTGQAVLELNKEDGGNRKFILCTNNESNIARDVTYPRIKTVVTGIRPDGSKYSDGIPANVRYFTTDFIKKGVTNDVTRAKLFEKSDEMIQVRENAFEFVDKNDNYTFYKNNEEFVAIIKDPFSFGPIWYELEEKNIEKLPVKLYVFSYSNYTFEDEIPDTDLKYEICAIPNSIMEVYRKTVEKKEDK